ncbi:MAG: hypothetical protein ACPGUV_05295 [Polyangiales bacterium]
MVLFWAGAQGCAVEQEAILAGAVKHSSGQEQRACHSWSCVLSQAWLAGCSQEEVERHVRESDATTAYQRDDNGLYYVEISADGRDQSNSLQSGRRWFALSFLVQGESHVSSDEARGESVEKMRNVAALLSKEMSCVAYPSLEQADHWKVDSAERYNMMAHGLDPAVVGERLHQLLDSPRSTETAGNFDSSNALRCVRGTGIGAAQVEVVAQTKEYLQLLVSAAKVDGWERW